MTKFPFGTDYKLILDEDGQLDVDTTFAIETDPAKVLVWDLLKTITTGQGVLWWAPTSTEDVNESLLDGMNSTILGELQSRLKTVIDADPRFTSVEVLTRLMGREVSISIKATAGDETISLVVVVQENGTLRVEEANGAV